MGSGEHLCELDQVAPRVGEKREPTTDDGQLERFGDDPDAAAAKLGDRLIDTGDIEAEVMEAREAQAVAQILIHRFRDRSGRAITEQLDEECIVGRPARDRPDADRRTGHSCTTRKSSFSTYQRLAAAKSGTRTATWWPFIEAKGLFSLRAGMLTTDMTAAPFDPGEAAPFDGWRSG